MTGFTVVHHRHLSDLPFDHINERVLEHIISTPAKVPPEVESHGDSNKALKGVTLWHDPFEENIKVSHTVLVPRRDVYPDDFAEKIRSDLKNVADYAHSYHVQLHNKGDTWTGIGVRRVDKGAVPQSTHYQAIKDIADRMKQHNVPIVHYLLHPTDSGKALIIAKLAKPLVAGVPGDHMYESPEDVKRSKTYRKLADAYRQELELFLRNVLVQGKGRIYSAYIH
ncbi:MAG: hypothetical protein QXU32_09495 [Nitrososphaerales archaeon]